MKTGAAIGWLAIPGHFFASRWSSRRLHNSCRMSSVQTSLPIAFKRASFLQESSNRYKGSWNVVSPKSVNPVRRLAASIKLSMSRGRTINPAFFNAFKVQLNARIRKRRRTGGESVIPTKGIGFWRRILLDFRAGSFDALKLAQDKPSDALDACPEVQVQNIGNTLGSKHR